MFDADRPISNNTQDRLGRAEFAKYLARCILDHKSPESLVIGLQGGWGSGKTSLINLIIQEFNTASSSLLDEEKPIILNFSPWSYSGQNQLIYGFFRRLSSELRRSPYLKNSNEIIQLLELYVSFFTHQPIPKLAKPKQKLFARFKKMRFGKEKDAWESGRDPTLVKAELNNLLRQHKHKIIIIIDNISRLEPKEMTQILQIVKSMGDYTNTIYMLAYDQPQVIKAIDSVRNGEGKQYLEKLIQLPFDIPQISKQDLENMLIDKLQKTVASVPEGGWNNTYWSDAYYSALKYFFNSSRDITRYVNTLGFSYLRVKDVVNAVDFFALTGIEVFEPKVYLSIRENKDLFTDLLENVYVFDEEKMKKDKLRCDEILQRATNIPIHILQQLLILLFPRLRSMYVPNEHFYHSSSLARKNKRVCSPDIFDVYFRLSIPSGYMPESELETILSLTYDGNSFGEALLRLNQDGRVTKFLDLLDSTAIHKIHKKNIGKVIGALMDSADLFPEGETNLLNFNTAMRIHRICNQLLQSVSNSNERYEILLAAIRASNKSLYVLVHELILQGEEHIENEDTAIPLEHRTLSSDQLVKLQQAVIERIEFWARIGRLSEHPKLLPILYAWKNWGSENQCMAYVTQMIREDKGIIAFLCAALKEPVDQAIAKQKKNPDWIRYLENITNFIPIDIIEPRAILLFEDEGFEKLREKEQLAILIFLDLIKAKTIKVIPKTTA